MALIAFSGRKTCGKDTSGKIAQILLDSPHLNNNGVKDFLRKDVDPDGTYHSKWEIRKFADKLKEITCTLIGCTREQLEDEAFKNTPLGKEWNKWELYNPTSPSNSIYGTYLSEEAAEEAKKSLPILIWSTDMAIRKVRMTPRLLLQLLGTECGRQIIHPQIWVNSTFADYRSVLSSNHPVDDLDWEPRFVYPNWIITDMRFPNEAQAIQGKEGLLIRIERPWFYQLLEDGTHEFSEKEDKTGQLYRIAAKYTKEEAEAIYKEDYASKVHESETALDGFEGWNYLIYNDTTIDDLINAIRNILIGEGLLTKN